MFFYRSFFILLGMVFSSLSMDQPPLLQENVFISLEDCAIAHRQFPDHVLKHFKTLQDMRECYNEESWYTLFKASLSTYKLANTTKNLFPPLKEFSQILQVAYQTATLLEPTNRYSLLTEVFTKDVYRTIYNMPNKQAADQRIEEYITPVIKKLWIHSHKNLAPLTMWRFSLTNEKNREEVLEETNTIRAEVINIYRKGVLEKSCEYLNIFSPKTIAKSLLLLDYLCPTEAIMQPAIDLLLLSGTYDALKSLSVVPYYFNKLKKLKKEYQFDINKLYIYNPQFFLNCSNSGCMYRNANLFSIKGLEKIKNREYYTNREPDNFDLSGNNLRHANLAYIRKIYPKVIQWDFSGNKNIHIKSNDLWVPVGSRYFSNSLNLKNCCLRQFPINALSSSERWVIKVEENAFSREQINKINFINRIRQLKYRFLLTVELFMPIVIGIVLGRYVYNWCGAGIEQVREDTIKIYIQQHLTEKYDSNTLLYGINFLRNHPDIISSETLKHLLLPNDANTIINSGQNIDNKTLLKIISFISALKKIPDQFNSLALVLQMFTATVTTFLGWVGIDIPTQKILDSKHLYEKYREHSIESP